MSPGSVVIDVAIDQGGIIETADHVSTHDHPTYLKYGVLHYAVANMPGAVPRTSTIALSHATTPYIRLIASHGILHAAQHGVESGFNVAGGSITHPNVARDLGFDYVPALQALS